MVSCEFLCVLCPIFGAIFGYMLRRNAQLSRVLICLCVAVSSVISWKIFFAFEQNYCINVVPWIKIGELSVDWSIYIDKLTAVMMIVVTTVSFVVHLYSTGYMAHDNGEIRFLSYLSMFTFFMLVLVTSRNIMQLFVGWEGVGLCSYLLIGFWFHKDSANKSAMKAFIVNRVGDLFFLLGILLLLHIFHTVNFDEIFRVIEGGLALESYSILGLHVTLLDLACIMLFFGCMGKSAQLGLHVWLPDAMEGPTPASALIHAATMVTAGVFLIARSSPIFELSAIARDIVFAVGVATCVAAAAIATVQSDIKKIIAYSTSSQLGYMFMACGVSSYNLAIFHLLTHAFFKSMLFLLAGNVIHSNNGEQRITHMSKNCWLDTPYTYGLMWVGSLALMGVFPLAGHYSKDLIIESSYENIVGFVLANLSASFTAFYSCRLMMEVFHNSSSERISSIHESKKMMLVPLLVLLIGTVFSGMWGKGMLKITEQEFWVGSMKVHEMHEEISAILEHMPSIMVVLGSGAYLLHRRYGLRNFVPNMLIFLLEKKLYFDEVYNYIFVVQMRKIATIFWTIVEQKVIDCWVLGGITRAICMCSEGSVIIQNGKVERYALFTLVGAVTVVLIVVYGLKVQ